MNISIARLPYFSKLKEASQNQNKTFYKSYVISGIPTKPWFMNGQIRLAIVLLVLFVKEKPPSCKLNDYEYNFAFYNKCLEKQQTVFFLLFFYLTDSPIDL